VNRNWSTYFALFKDDETSLSLKQKFVKFSTVWHKGLLFYPFNFPSFGVLKLWYTLLWQLAPDWGCCNVEQSSYVGYRTSFYWDSHRTIFLLVE